MLNTRLSPSSLFFSPINPSNELKGQSTNKTISRNETPQCVNALLIPVSKFHPPAVCLTLMRNKIAGTQGERDFRRRLRGDSPITLLRGRLGCYSWAEAWFQPPDSVGLIKEHISICSHSNGPSLFLRHQPVSPLFSSALSSLRFSASSVWEGFFECHLNVFVIVSQFHCP